MFLPYDLLGNLSDCCRLAVITQTTDDALLERINLDIPAAAAQALREDLGGESRCWQRYHQQLFASRYAKPMPRDHREDGVFAASAGLKRFIQLAGDDAPHRMSMTATPFTPTKQCLN